jgi:hypothetical protein
MMLEFTADNWENHPCVKGRQAVLEDVRDNRATFTSVNATADDAALESCPLPAILTTEDGDKVSVIVLQAQVLKDGSGLTFGAVGQNGQPYVATANEILILKRPTSEWTANLETSK